MDCIGISRFGTGRHGRWLVALLSLLCSLACTLAAGPPTPPRRIAPARPRPAPDGQRFLFVVDISSAMRATDAANRQALFDMLFTGLDGQMRTGDTFGLWLYNDKLHAGTFPMQIWDEKDPLPVASLATKFLRDQSYAGRSRPDVLMPRLLSLIKNVRDVDVLVISRGKPALQGTSFDTNIAAIVKRKSTEREQAQKPFITALTARGGAIVRGAVVIAGEAILLPERPVANLAAKGTNGVAQLTNATAGLNSERGTRNPEPLPQATAPITPQPAPPPKPKVMEFVTRSNAVATNAAVVAAPTPEVAPSNQTPATPLVTTTTGTTVPATNATRAQDSGPSSEGFSTSLKPGTRNPEPGTAIANPEPRQQTSGDTTPAIPVQASVTSLAKALDADPVPVAARSPAPNGPSVAAAVVEAPTPGLSAALLLTIGVVLLAACLGLLLLVLRKLRPRRQGSFITQSMELR